MVNGRRGRVGGERARPGLSFCRASLGLLSNAAFLHRIARGQRYQVSLEAATASLLSDSSASYTVQDPLSSRFGWRSASWTLSRYATRCRARRHGNRATKSRKEEDRKRRGKRGRSVLREKQHASRWKDETEVLKHARHGDVERAEGPVRMKRIDGQDRERKERRAATDEPWAGW